MKKSILALAVTATLPGLASVAYADTTLQDSARLSAIYPYEFGVDMTKGGNFNSYGCWVMVGGRLVWMDPCPN